MIKPPIDILLLIFSFLTQNDKLECMTVCRHWEHVLQHNLFQVICIHREDQLNTLIEKVKKEPILGTKVERLIIKPQLNKDFDETIFTKLFPNLRDFTSVILKEYDAGDRTPIAPHKGHPWSELIVKIAGQYLDQNINSLLLAGTCKNLTSLTLSAPEREPARDLIQSLANAPRLKKLFLKSFMIFFEDLELLHKNAPLLNSLILESCPVRFDDALPDITPATSMKSFQCVSNNMKSIASLSRQCQYISQKYTNLEVLIIDPIPSTPNGGDVSTLRRTVIEPIMKSLGPQLNTLSLCRMDRLIHEYYAMIDEYGCKIKKLVLNGPLEIAGLRQLAETTQVQYIESLTLNAIDYYEFEDGNMSLDWLSSFTMLKELTLNYSWNVDEQDLIELIEKLSNAQLETLRLGRMKLTLDGSDTTRVYPSLKNLFLSGVEFEEGIDTCIAQLFPNLKRLSFNECFKRGDLFVLPKIDLSFLEIINRHEEEPFPILLITLGDKQQRVYSTSTIPYGFQSNQEDSQEDTFTLPYISSRPLCKSTDVPMVTIKCNSVYNVVLINSSE